MRAITHPSRSLLIGKSNVGKTTTLVEIVLSRFIVQVNDIYVLSKTYHLQKTFDPIRKYVTAFSPNANEEFFFALKTKMEEDKYQRKSLLIIDDQSDAAILNNGSKGIFAEFQYNARHYNLSIILVSHRVTAVSVAARENNEHTIIFQQQNPKQINQIADEFNPLETKKEFLEFYRSVMRTNPHGAIHIFDKAPVTIHPNFSVTKNANQQVQRGNHNDFRAHQKLPQLYSGKPVNGYSRFQN